MPQIGVIGGTGLTSLPGLEITRKEVVNTPWGEPSAPLVHGRFYDRDIVFLARHGFNSSIPPHRVNYRANIAAMRNQGIDYLIAVNAVGGIREDIATGALVIPHQVIDYTSGREHSYYDDCSQRVQHVDFTHPYCEELRQLLLAGAGAAKIGVHDGGVYGATQGPRLESAAEIDRMERDGCDIVGMTAMPEAVLARELALCYASIAVVANAAAGRAPGSITIADIEVALVKGMASVREVIGNTVPLVLLDD